MIVWSGWGIMVAIITAVAFLIGIGVGTATGLPYNLATALGYVVTGVLAGGGLFLLTRAVENRPGRVFIDEQTGERIEVRNSAGSFFFVPTRFWTFIVPVLSLVLAGAMFFNKNPPTSELEAYDSVRSDILEHAPKANPAVAQTAEQRAAAESAQQTAQPAEASQAGGGGS